MTDRQFKVCCSVAMVLMWILVAALYVRVFHMEKAIIANSERIAIAAERMAQQQVVEIPVEEGK